MFGSTAMITTGKSVCRRCVVVSQALATLFFSAAAIATPTAVDDTVAVPSNTTVFANDVAANDTLQPGDIYTIVVPPENGTATLTSNGLLDYTPNIGFASTDTLTYSVDDGAGGMATATVTLDVVLTSDFLTPVSSFLVGQEDVPTPLSLTVDPSLEFGGTLQDIIGVDVLYRAENAGNTPVATTIPTGTTSINITGFGTRNTGTNLTDNYNDDYQQFSVNVDLREGTYSGRLTYSVLPDAEPPSIDQYSWINVPLSQSVLTDTSFVSGDWTGASDPVIDLVAGQITIAETIPLQTAYHVEFMTADGDSSDFISVSGAVQRPNESVSSFEIPAELRPAGTAKQGYAVITGNSAANGANFNEEHKGFSRLVVDLESGLVSGVIASARGELDTLVTTWAFVDYPLVDLQQTPGATPVSITSSTASIVGDTTAPAGVGVEDDPTLYLDAAGELVIERAAAHAAAFTTMFTSEYYRRTELSSIASFVGVESDTSLFDSNPPDGVDANGKPVNIQTFNIPASSSVGLVQMSWQTFGGSATNENVGFGFAVIDLTKNTSAGSVTFSRTTTPDLVSWQGVPLGTTMFGATDGGVPLFQSNKAPGDFTDDYPETLRFTLVNNADGTRTLELTATSNAGTGAFADYIGNTQISWLGSEPFMVEGVPGNGTLSHGSPVGNGGWEVDFSDIPLLTISMNDHESGELQLDMVLASTGEMDSIVVHVQPVVDPPAIVANDALGYAGNATPLSVSTVDSADVDGSETQLQVLNLSGVPTTVNLTSSNGTVTNFGGGNWQVDRAALAALSASNATAVSATVTVSGTNTDMHDLDGDSVIEDTNNGAGVDEVDTATYQDTFELVIRDLPTVVSQTANTGTPAISGTAIVGGTETLEVVVNGVSYTGGDGNLVANADGTWDLTIPPANLIADGVYAVTATISDTAGGSGVDVTTDELIIDTVLPTIPTVVALQTIDTTPIVSGTATVSAGETLTVTINGNTYTAGDGQLVLNGDGSWDLAVPAVNLLPVGIYEVTVAVTDAAGNTSIDASSAELEILPSPAPTVISQVTTNTTPVVSGMATLSTGDTLSVTLNGVTYTAGDGNLIYNSNGTWNLTLPLPHPDDTYEVVASVTDIAGNVQSDTSSDELIIDTTAPLAPTVNSQTTLQTMPLITGTSVIASGETLTVTVNGFSYTAGDGHLVDNNDGTWALLIPVALIEATYEVNATITDAAGNTATDTSSDELIIDISAPAIPTVSFLTTSDTTPVVSGTAILAAGELLSVSVAGSTYNAGDGFLVDNGDATWDLNLPTVLADGSYSVTATITDSAGNASDDSTSLELTIDTLAPVTPTVASQTTSTTSPVITGTANVAPDDTLTVTVDGITYTEGDGYLTDNGDGTWALAVPAVLVEGNYDVVVTVTDAAGNASSDTTVGELIIDLTPPAAPGVTSLSTTDTTPVIEGTATLNPGEILTVTVDGFTYTAGDGDLVDFGDGTWALTIPATRLLAENLYQVVAKVTDAAGNSVIDPGVDDLLVDLTAPSAPGVTSLTTNNITPVIAGTATVSQGETLSVTVNGITYISGDGNLVDNADGTWELTIPADDAMAEGIYDVTATQTDSAGNTSTDPSSGELLIDTTPPATPTANPLITNDTTPVLMGMANPGPGETLTVTVNGVTYSAGDGNLVNNSDGSWTLTIPAPLNEAVYDVAVNVTDAAGNISSDTSSNELVVDVTAPAIPTITAQVTNNPNPLISGTTTSTPGETLSVTVNGVTYVAGDGNLVDNGDGTWDLAIPAGAALTGGTYDIVATITDLAGNTSADTSADELIVDTTAPAIPTVTALISSNTTPVLMGTATVAADETLAVVVDGVTYTAGDGNLVDNGDGTWALTLPTSLVDSTYAVTVTVIDAAGNTSVDTTSAELIIDTTAPVVPTITPLTTSNTTPSLQGSATISTGETLTVEVDGVIYTTGDGNLVDNGDGTWLLTLPVAHSDGPYEVIATVTDAAGNASSDSTATELVIDTTAPAIPTVMSLITNDTTPILEGTATIAPGDILTVTVNGTLYTAGDGFLVDNSDGTWTLTLPVAQPDGTYEVIATVTDAASNASSDTTAAELVIDTTAPPIPAVIALTTNDTTPVVQGSATISAGETLTVELDGVLYTAGDGNLVDNGDGTWALSIATPLAEGIYEVIATITDVAGNMSSDNTVDELVIDTTPPPIPTVLAQTTNNPAPPVSGMASISPGDTLTVTIDGVTYTAGDGFLTDNGDGTWTLAHPVPLAEGAYDVVVTVTDAAGNSSIDTTAGELVIDLTAPLAPGVTSQTTNVATPTIEGTVTLNAGEVLTVTVDGVIYTAGDGDLVDNGDGSWALTIPATQSLAENLYQVVATVTDTAGNSAFDPGVDDLLVDLTAPSAPGVTSLTTNDTTPVIAGTVTASPGETLSVTVNGITYLNGDGNLVDNGDGSWELTIPAGDDMAEGIYDVTATLTDSAGNISSDPSSSELLIDTSAPTTPTVDPLITSDTTPVLSGMANPGAGEVLNVEVNGVTYTAGDGNLVVLANGTWTLSIPTPLAEGSYEVIATVTDAAGNVTSDSSTNELLVDITPPPVPTVTALITSNPTPLISGTATTVAGETLSISINGVTYTTGDSNLVDNGDGTWDLTIPAASSLLDGIYEVIATIRDLADNTTTDVTADELIVDTTAPVIPTVTTLITSNNTPVLMGTATVAADETLTVELDGVTYTAGDGNLVDNGDGTWALTLPTSLLDSTYAVTVTVIDAAGNTSVDVTSAELIVDTTAPVVPTVTALTTSDNTPALQGSATMAAEEILTVEVDGITYTAGDGNLVDNGDGTWTLNIPTPLTEGVYEVIATITDAAGNVSSDITVEELAIDTTPPPVPTVVAQTTNNPAPVVTGTATVNPGDILTVTIEGVTYTAGDGFLTDNGDGTWVLALSLPLADGAYDVVVSINDAVSNVSIDTTTSELVIDLTAPVAPGVTSQITNNGNPIIEGTVTLGPGEVLTVAVDGVTYTAGDGDLVDNDDGTWTLIIPATQPLAENLYQVVATVSDIAGNSSLDPGVDDLLVDLTAPSAPGVTSLTTNDTTPVIAGTAMISPGETLSVMVNGITYLVGDGNLIDNGDGTWELTIPASDAISEGSYDVTATLTDSAGNISSDPSSSELLIDTTAPTTPTVDPLITNETTPILTGMANPGTGEVLTVEVDGVTYTAGDGNLVVDSDGTWMLSIPDSLLEGIYDVNVILTDSAGNTRPDPSSGELQVDTTPPPIPTVDSVITNNTTPVLSGIANPGPGEILTVEIDGVIFIAGDGNLVINPDGTWVLSIPTPLAEGSYDVIVSLTDVAGNTSTDSSSGELLIDTTAPQTPSADPQSTNDTTPVLSGIAHPGPGETLSVEVNGITYIAGDENLVDNGDGTWSLTIPSALPEGTHNVTVTVIDQAGNVISDTSDSELLIDTTLPALPTVNPLLTNISTPLLSGTATVGTGEILTVSINGVTYSEGDGNLVDLGDGIWQLKVIAPLTDGQYQVTASVTDGVGNLTRDITEGELIVDLIPPATPIITPLVTDNPTPALTIVASLEPGEMLSIVVNGISHDPGDGNLVDNGDGTWTLFIPDELSPGAYDVFYSVSDLAGNTIAGEAVGSLLIESTVEEADFDGDGVPDALDLDSDNDGIPDTAEGSRDSDGDGQPDYRDLDSDNDGIADTVEVAGGDADNNYLVDDFIDENNNGLSDELEPFPYELIDTDSDLIPDYRDRDSDNDGITDLLESGGLDEDHDGQIDGFTDTNNDGADDANQLTPQSGIDTDNDGVFNRHDLDTDNDGIFDVVEAGSLDDLNNGILDIMHDADLDGIPDNVDIDMTMGIDEDSDGIDDRFDASFLDEPDDDSDGIVNSADPDADGDGFADGSFGQLALGAALPDTNGNGQADLVEPFSGVIHTGLAGYGGCSYLDTGNGRPLPDPLLPLLAAISAAALIRRRRIGQPRMQAQYSR